MSNVPTDVELSTTSSSSAQSSTRSELSRAVLIGVGGASCTGKTTLAKHLKRILPGSVILHQDDFAPPAEQVPYHPTLGIQDWDAAPGAIEWDRFRTTLRTIRRTGSLPPEHSSHDDANKQVPVPIDEAVGDRWRERFAQRAEQEKGKDGEGKTYVVCDGFLMYWDEEAARELDVKILLRESYGTLKDRRENRNVYITAEGMTWEDPPNYFPNIVWPAYKDAHAKLFIDGDVERGELRKDGTAEGMMLFEAERTGMTEMVERACQAVWDRGAG